MSDNVVRLGMTAWKDQGCGDVEVERLAHAVIGAAIEVHRLMGPGLPESAYELALCHELALRDIPHVRQSEVPLVYKGKSVGRGYVDVLVAGRLVVELKACEPSPKLHRAQVVAYLCALNLPLGLLINFNVSSLQEGLKRVINTDHN